MLQLVVFYLLVRLRISTAFSSQTAKLSPWDTYKPLFPDLDVHQWELLDQLAFSLFDWNKKVNLISRKDIDQLLPRHIVPCLSISLVRKFGNGERIIDVGTGGGLPGLPLAIACPNAHFTLIDSNTKKISIVEDIRSVLGLTNVEVIRTRAEDYSERFDFMLGRSVSAIPKFLAFSSHFLRDRSVAIDTGLLYLKGGEFNEELKEAGISNFKLTEVSSITGLESDKKVLYVPAQEILAFNKRLKS